MKSRVHTHRVQKVAFSFATQYLVFRRVGTVSNSNYDHMCISRKYCFIKLNPNNLGFKANPQR